MYLALIKIKAVWNTKYHYLINSFIGNIWNYCPPLNLILHYHCYNLIMSRLYYHLYYPESFHIPILLSYILHLDYMARIIDNLNLMKYSYIIPISSLSYFFTELIWYFSQKSMGYSQKFALISDHLGADAHATYVV